MAAATLRMSGTLPPLLALGAGLGRGLLGERRHRLEVRAGEAADDGEVESAELGELPLRSLRIGLGDSNGADLLAQALEVVLVAVVKLAVEGLLLGEARPRVVADGGAHV